MDTDEYLDTLEDAEGLLDRLRALYEQYFQGFERLEPHVPRKDLERTIARLRRIPQRNTALRFRFNRLIQKHTTYQAYWRRVGRQIEEGTYLRHVMRAREKRSAARAERLSQSPNSFELELDVEVDMDALSKEAEASVQQHADRARAERLLGDSAVAEALSVLKPMTSLPANPGARRTSISPFAVNQKAPAPPEPANTIVAPRPAAMTGIAPPHVPGNRTGRGATANGPNSSYKPPAPGGISPLTQKQMKRRTPVPVDKQRSPRAIAGGAEVNMRKVYDRYVAARQKNNERVDNVRYESLEKGIKKMMPALQKKHGGKKIDFEVVIKNGKVGLKPVPKKG